MVLVTGVFLLQFSDTVGFVKILAPRVRNGPYFPSPSLYALTPGETTHTFFEPVY